MDIKLLLLKTITLLYYRSHTSTGKNTSTDLLVSDIIERIELPDDQTNLNTERNVIVKLRSLLIWMSRNDHDYKYDIDDLMTRLRVACGDSDRIYDLFVRSILSVKDPLQAEDQVSKIVNELVQFNALRNLQSVMKNASRQINFDSDKIDDLGRWRTDLMTKLEALPLEGKRKLSSATRIVDISDTDSVSSIFEAAQTRIDPNMILKFPYKGLNDFTGPQQGLLRGDWSLHCALPGQNKTGVLLDIFCGWAVLNQPKALDPSKVPALVYVTIEDPIETTMQKMYTILKQVDTGLPVKVVGVPFSDMAEFVKDKFEQHGWKIFVLEFPVGGHPDEYLQIFRDLEDQNYEIAGVCCDYVNLIGKQGVHAVVAGDEIKHLHRKLRGFFNPKKITHCSVHQLGPKAKEMFRIDPVDYVRKLSNQGSFEGCTSLDTEADFIFYVAKTQHNKGAWWGQFQFDKHRRIGTLPDHLKYFSMKFSEYPMMNFKWDVFDAKSGAYDKVGAMKAKPIANWETLAEIGGLGHDEDGDASNDFIDDLSF